MTYCYPHRSMHHSPFIREASSCSVWQLKWKSTTSQCAENQRHWNIQPSGGLGDIPSLNIRGSVWKQDQKDY